MTTDEIFSYISKRMVEGLMFHSQMEDYYNFLGLWGFARCHRFHYFHESFNYKKIGSYYIQHYGKLIKEMQFEDPNSVPVNWFEYNRKDVSVSTKKAAIQSGVEKWINWEKDTKRYYENFYVELMNLGEIAAALELEKYVKDVDKELAEAENKWNKLSSMDYNVNDIILEQSKIDKKYHKKIKEIELC